MFECSSPMSLKQLEDGLHQRHICSFHHFSSMTKMVWLITSVLDTFTVMLINFTGSLQRKATHTTCLGTLIIAKFFSEYLWIFVCVCSDLWVIWAQNDSKSLTLLQATASSRNYIWNVIHFLSVLVLSWSPSLGGQHWIVVSLAHLLHACESPKCCKFFGFKK